MANILPEFYFTCFSFLTLVYFILKFPRYGFCYIYSKLYVLYSNLYIFVYFLYSKFIYMVGIEIVYLEKLKVKLINISGKDT